MKLRRFLTSLVLVLSTPAMVFAQTGATSSQNSAQLTVQQKIDQLTQMDAILAKAKADLDSAGKSQATGSILVSTGLIMGMISGLSLACAILPAIGLAVEGRPNAQLFKISGVLAGILALATTAYGQGQKMVEIGAEDAKRLRESITSLEKETSSARQSLLGIQR